MIGYKGFDENLCCRGFQYEIGKEYTYEGEIELCSAGFHFCKDVLSIHNFYNLQSSRICEVEATGDIIESNEGDNKCVTNKIKIIKELTHWEFIKLMNSGNHNSGDWNSGDWNSGDWNSGNRNSGNRNSGDCNSGNRNSGDCNSGDCNSGNRNSGDWNSGSFNSGFFCSDEPFIRIFNKNTKKKRDEINFPSWLYFDLTLWVSYDTATDEEKEIHKKEIEICGGFVKTLTYQEAFRHAWDCASLSDKKKLFDLPNWNNKIFKEISGIDAEKEIKMIGI